MEYPKVGGTVKVIFPSQKGNLAGASLLEARVLGFRVNEAGISISAVTEGHIFYRASYSEEYEAWIVKSSDVRKHHASRTAALMEILGCRQPEVRKNVWEADLSDLKKERLCAFLFLQ